MTAQTPTLVALIADGSDELRASVTPCLAGLGYDVAAAATPGEALALIQGRYFDRVLADSLIMADNAQEIARDVQAHYPSTRIVALVRGGQSFAECAHLVRGVAAHGVLLKPFTPSELIQVVKAAVPSPQFLERNPPIR